MDDFQQQAGAQTKADGELLLFQISGNVKLFVHDKVKFIVIFNGKFAEEPLGEISHFSGHFFVCVRGCGADTGVNAAVIELFNDARINSPPFGS